MIKSSGIIMSKTITANVHISKAIATAISNNRFTLFELKSIMKSDYFVNTIEQIAQNNIATVEVKAINTKPLPYEFSQSIVSFEDSTKFELILNTYFDKEFLKQNKKLDKEKVKTYSKEHTRQKQLTAITSHIEKLQKAKEQFLINFEKQKERNLSDLPNENSIFVIRSSDSDKNGFNTYIEMLNNNLSQYIGIAFLGKNSGYENKITRFAFEYFINIQLPSKPSRFSRNIRDVELLTAYREHRFLFKNDYNECKPLSLSELMLYIIILISELMQYAKLAYVMPLTNWKAITTYEELNDKDKIALNNYAMNGCETLPKAKSKEEMLKKVFANYRENHSL